MAKRFTLQRPQFFGVESRDPGIERVKWDRVLREALADERLL